MRKTLQKYSIAALITLAGFGIGHSTVRASSPDPGAPERETACSKTGDAGGRATASAMSSPYYCVCCDATGDARCCSKC